MLPTHKRIFVAGYFQTVFGKFGPLKVPEIVHQALQGVSKEAGAPLDAVDAVSVAALLAQPLCDQTLIAGIVASEPGLAGKPIETVENACSSGGVAILSVVQKILLGLGHVGIALGIEKMRNDEGRMDGAMIGKVLGTASHPDDRPGKTFVFPHLFAEVMDKYIKAWSVTEEQLAHVPVTFYRHAQNNPYAQMRGVEMTVEKVMTLAGPNRYIADGLPLKTFECSQISDGSAAIVLADEEGLRRLGIPQSACAELVGFGQATDPLSTKGRDVLRPAGALKAMKQAYDMAGIGPRDVSLAEVHDCFGIMGALSVEILGLAEAGRGAQYYVDGKASLGGGGSPINTSGGLIAKGHPIGATGVAMVGWNYWQLMGKAPAAAQVKDARYAATFNIGGPICASVTTVLKAP
ncbi:MAG: thiolase family protein [Deltaproteobacteria bacterium]|nr:thiolase family protein [Deltaproteobacteria bacterium]